MTPQGWFRRLIARDKRLLAFALLALSAAWLVPLVQMPRSTYHYMVTLDITQSMNVPDMSLDGRPVSRLVLARTALQRLLQALPCGSELGLSAFTDYRSLPLLTPIEVCANYEVLLATLEHVGADMRWAEASNIGKGLYWSVRNAQGLGQTQVVYITDGQESPPLRPGQNPMPQLEPAPIAGVVIGVGADLPSPIPRAASDGTAMGTWTAEDVVQRTDLPPGRSHEHLSELREAYLQTLARSTGLDYVRLTGPDALVNALLVRQRARQQPAATDLSWLPAGLALCLLVADHWPAVGRRRRSTVRQPTTQLNAGTARRPR